MPAKLTGKKAQLECVKVQKSIYMERKERHNNDNKVEKSLLYYSQFKRVLADQNMI